MCELQKSRRTVSLVLALALSLWVQMGSATAQPEPLHLACHMALGHSQPVHSTANHRCCPGFHATQASVLPSLMEGTLCHQDCCTVRQQPERTLPFVANAGVSVAHALDTVATTTDAHPTRVLGKSLQHSRPFSRAVFDLKADLRI